MGEAMFTKDELKLIAVLLKIAWETGAVQSPEMAVIMFAVQEKVKAALEEKKEGGKE